MVLLLWLYQSEFVFNWSIVWVQTFFLWREFSGVFCWPGDGAQSRLSVASVVKLEEFRWAREHGLTCQRLPTSMVYR